VRLDAPTHPQLPLSRLTPEPAFFAVLPPNIWVGPPTVAVQENSDVMKIGIIGSGNIGGALTRRLTAAGHDVSVANARGPASLSGLVQETGACAAAIQDVVRDKDVVVIAIPLSKIGTLPPDLFQDAPSKLAVVDTSNYYPRQRDGRIPEIEAGLPESAWVEQHLGHKVVKAFNTILAEHLRENKTTGGSAGRVALAVAGDDPAAKTLVGQMIETIGFDTVDAGPISGSWRQQPGSPGYLKDYDADGVRRALAVASCERTPEWTATANSPGTYDNPA